MSHTPEHDKDCAGCHALMLLDRAEAAEQQLTDLRAAIGALIWGTFTPDFRGVDWADDAAIQAFVRDLHALVGAQS